MPRVSIIIPCYQHGHLLGEAIESALGQNHSDIEVIVIDDGSTDSTRAVVDEFIRRHPAKINLITQARAGQNAARQRGLEAATGDTCLMLDADDLLEPNAVRSCLDAFDAHPEADAIVGDALIVGADGKKILRTHTQSVIVGWPDILKRNPYGVNLGVMARTASVRAAGGLAFSHAGCEDWDVWCRMARCGMKFVHIDAILGRYRQTGQNHTRNVLGNLRATIAMLDLAGSKDLRLERAGREVAAPIGRELYAIYRNGRVFHALGTALGFGLPEGEWPAIMGELTEGGLVTSWCAEQFVEGMEFALAGRTGRAPQVALGRFLGVLRETLKAKNQDGYGELRPAIIHAVRQLTGRRSVIYLAQRLREKLS